MIVVDTNVLAYLLAPGPRFALAGHVLERDREWRAPVLWRSEFRHFLARRVRDGSLPAAEALVLAGRARALLEPRGERLEVSDGPVLAIAARSGCSAYDCEFVVLAESLGVRLVTEDRQVLRAFPGTAVSMEEFAAGR